MSYEILPVFKDSVNYEQSLWRAVILQAFVDLKNNSRKKLANTFRVKATLWFNLKNKDFLKVCEYAGLDPEYVWSIAEYEKDVNYFKVSMNKANYKTCLSNKT